MRQKIVSSETLEQRLEVVRERGTEVIQTAHAFHGVLDSPDHQRHSLIAHTLLEQLDTLFLAVEAVERARETCPNPVNGDPKNVQSLRTIMRAYCAILDATDLQFIRPDSFAGSILPGRFRDSRWLEKLEVNRGQMLVDLVRPAIEYLCSETARFSFVRSNTSAGSIS